ncbi:cytochrome b561 [Escherichia coli]|uniref:Cytochrome b561 n=1 Tax=Escherichia coli TaxID=562 RepID=A0A377BHX3_ECOLX|nr:cytochrome b561 [Escherichia coli]
MENKYSRLQISIHWLVFLLVIAAYCAMEFRGFFHVAIGHSST